MKLKALIGDREEELLIKLEDGRISARIGNRVYELEVREIEVFDVTIHGRSHSVTIVDPKRLRSGQNSDRHHHGVAEIRAPMPGKVVRVQTEAGATVEKGAGVIVVEAMKMQNEMKSPRAGVVVSLNVQAGDTVNAGDVLAVIE
jgi:biotin carboxyl carrier protein